MSLLDQATQATGSLTFKSPQLPDSAGNLEDLLQSCIAQDTRLLELYTSADSGIANNTLLVHRLHGTEAINELFRYEIQVLSTDAFMELKSMQGVPSQVTILTDKGSKRCINGVVTEVRSEGTDGSLASYRLILEPVVAALKLSRSSRVFLGKTDLEVVLLLLQEEQKNNSVFCSCLNIDNRCMGDFPVREFIYMCDESKWNFIQRRLAKIGVSYVIVPTQDCSPDFPQHTLLFFNEPRDLDENEAGSVRFHRADGTEDSDSITQWYARRSLQCGKVTRRVWDHNSGSLSTTTEESKSDQGSFGNALTSTLEDYKHEAPLEHDNLEAHEALTISRARVKEQRTKDFAGEGSVRSFYTGSTFRLIDHPVHDQDYSQDRQFVLTRVEIEAVNNLPKTLKAGLRSMGVLAKALGLESSQTENDPLQQPFTFHFECIRMGVPILPDEIPPPNPGLQTATVVGLANEAVHTDELGRIKIRLHSTREQDNPEAGATLSDKDSFWIRLMQPWSSQGMGGNFIPRAGDEVGVSFLANDPDKPVITGVLPGGIRKPGRFSDASELPGDKAISGLRSREHGGTMGNQVLFDDTPGEIRTQLASDYEASELSLGFLVAPRTRGVAEPRGEGAELRTDGTAAIRAAKGLLLSASAQIRANGPQLAREELAQLFEAFGSLTDSLGNYAGQHQGLPPKTEPEKQLQGHLKDWETGTNTKPKTQRPGEGQRLIALSAPDGLVAVTSKTAVVYAGENLDLAAQQYSHVTVGQQLVVNAGKGLSLFSHSGGFKAIAHQDDFDLQAQHGDIVMTAAKNVKIFASENEILIAAPKKLTLMCGGSYLTLSTEGVVAGGPSFAGKVGRVSWPGPDSQSTSLPEVDMGKTQRRFRLAAVDDASQVLPNRGYKITLADGRVVEGTSDSNGLTSLVEDETLKLLHIGIKAPKPLS